MSAKEMAIKLREQGYPYSYISEKTGLAKSTLSYHLTNVVYEPNKATKRKLALVQLRSAETKHRQKQTKILKIRKVAEKEFDILSKRDLFVAGIALYAGEGSKTQNLVRLVNSDARIIRFFIKWLNLLGVDNNHIMLRVHGYPDTNRLAAEAYWLKETSLKDTQLQKMCVDTRAGKDLKRKGVHGYGTAHITVRANGNPELGFTLARKITAYMDLLLS
jgi:hypothetical protein